MLVAGNWIKFRAVASKNKSQKKKIQKWRQLNINLISANRRQNFLRFQESGNIFAFIGNYGFNDDQLFM